MDMFARVRDRDGNVRWIRIRGATDSTSARQFLQSRVGGGEVIEVVSNADWLSQNVSDFNPGNVSQSVLFAPVPNDPLSDTAQMGQAMANAPVSPPGPTGTLLERELADPAAAFRSFLEGQGAPTRGFTGGALRSAGRFLDPVITLSEAAGLNTPGAGLTERLPGIFAQGGITRGLGNLANQSLQTLGGATSPNASQQAFITPESFGSDEAIAVRQALQQALTGRNPFLGSRFGSQIDQELGRRASDSAFAGSDPLGTNFIKWAMSQVPT